jgi:chromosome segregation ATPase
MDEIRDHINQLRKDCQAVMRKLSAAGKILEDLEKEVNQLRASARLLRKRAISMAEQVKKASHLGNYIEVLTHKRARIEFSVQKIHKKNEGLLEVRSRLTAERLDLQGTIITLPETEELDCVYDTTDDEQ